MERIQSLAGELRQIADLRVEEDHLLAPHTTFRIGGPAALALFPATAEAAASALRAIARAEVPHAVIGRGSNLLCADAAVKIGGHKAADGRARLVLRLVLLGIHH